MLLRLLLRPLQISVALKLHGDTVTPLQLKLQIAEDFAETGQVLVKSLDAFKCFEDTLHLSNVRTLGFHDIFQKSCCSYSILQTTMIEGSAMACKQLQLSRQLGLECLSELPSFGRIFTEQSVADLPLIKPVDGINFSRGQLKELLSSIVDHDSPHDVLSGGFLCFNKHYAKLHSYALDLLDGPFLEGSPSIVELTIPTLSVLSITSGRFDTSRYRPDRPLCIFHKELRSYLSSDPWAPLDLVRRFMQLGAIWAYSQRNLKKGNVDKSNLVHRINVTFESLANMVRQESKLMAPWDLEVRLAMETVKALLAFDISATELSRLVTKAGYSDFGEIYEIICNMMDGLSESLSHSAKTVSTITRTKIDMLVVLSQFEVSPEKMLDYVGDLHSSKRIYGHPQNPRCRHLLVLLWSLNQSWRENRLSCFLISNHIFKHIPPGTDLKIMFKLGLSKWIPTRIKRSISRSKLTVLPAGSRETTELFSGSLVEDLVRQKNPEASVGTSVRITTKNGYRDLETYRETVYRLLLLVVRKHFTYCGHDRSVYPIFIQALSCHPFMNELFSSLLIEASILRIVIPFKLHPSMLEAMALPKSHTSSIVFLSHAYKYQQLKESTRNLESLVLIGHMRNCKDNKRAGLQLPSAMNYTSYLKSIRYANSIGVSPAGLERELRVSGRDLVKFSMCQCRFDELLGIPVGQEEGMRVLLNHS